MSRFYGNDYRIQDRPPPPRPPFEDEGPPPVDITAVGHTLWKLAQVGMGAFAGTLSGLFLGILLGAVMVSILGDSHWFVLSDWSVLVYGFLGSVFGWAVVGGLFGGILVWKDLS